MQITPKAITALQKLLSVNSPIHPHEIRNQEHSDSKSNQKSQQCQSSCQQDGINNRLKQKFMSPQEGIESLLRHSISKGSVNGKPQGNVKNELINVLKQNQNVKENTIKRNGDSLNQLLQPQTNAPQKEQSAKIDYKKKRPPQLGDIVQDDDNAQQKKVTTSKSLQKSPNNINKIGSGFFTSTHQKQTHKNVFGSLNEVLRQYIQQQSHKRQNGTDRNQEEIKVSENKLHSAQNKRMSQSLQPNYSNLLQELYLKTTKILTSYQTKETLWKQQKNSLKEEVKFLKQLLQQQQEESNQKNQK
ncbi:unnamed protein product (macronuclear) [Paramecium tetraurelia]|uniref:Enkurin domain-containing protein n=1 Tax=Paramecium tetraurelia TaxID=5888 RepID=A0BMS7_PARTE|nr:uncharacterized protein GSPATT00030480001 [Paramecium tetraurelia]CAK59844.1 unnamed protein product [Paramecium tetraurelia]|eukprot:XP_001427242.1 hypothetical protein (macronuclear) [Paramecium tetraurelia strain d4-2]